MGNVFINPYTFVPFPQQELDRRSPAGHDSLAGGDGTRYMGALGVELKARTRLLVRGDGQGPAHRDGVPIIPGSALHGALRAMHETLVGGCLRVFDEDFVPSYRDNIVPGMINGWQLAVVEEVEGPGDQAGRPTRITVCTKYGIARNTQVSRQTERELLHTGTRLSIDGRTEQKNGRKVFPRDTPMAEDPAGDWVLLLTDGNARQKPRAGQNKPKNPNEIPYYVVLGRCAGGTSLTSRPGAPAVSDAAWATFVRAASGSDDVRRASASRHKRDSLRDAEVAAAIANWKALAPTDPVRASWTQGTQDAPDLAEKRVTVNETPARDIGWRAPHRPWLFPGLPIWVRLQDGVVAEIRLAMAWRHVGTGPARKRVPATMLACTEAANLCPSCRVFGAADTLGRLPEEAATQESYRGHVRVGDLVPVGPVALEDLTLTVMGDPRPGAGQFYLQTPPGLPLPANDATRALREWGSPQGDPLEEEPRLLRGRKAYWRTTDRAKLPRWKAREHQVNDRSMSATTAQAFPAGTRMRATIHFDGLTAAEIGALLCALNPTLVLSPSAPGKELVFTIGGGKPFGFGAATVNAHIERLETPDSRWTGGPAPQLSVAEAVAAFQATNPVAQDTWPELAIAATLDHVDPELVWYPPGAGWDQVGTDAFDKGYEFWAESIGRAGKDSGDKKLVQLPLITAADQAIPIIAKKDGGGQRATGGAGSRGGNPQPKQVQPQRAQPGPGKPVPSKPVPSKAGAGQATPGNPVPGKPGTSRPSPGKPVPGKPVPGRPGLGGPVPGRPVPGQPRPGQPRGKDGKP